jgi:ribosome-associated protein
MAAMARESTGIGEAIRVTRSVTVPRREIELRFSRSSGPGGQHAQRTETRVEALFDVGASTALTERQRKRVMAKAGPVLRGIAQDERSQWQNRELATARVIDALRAALEVPRRRKHTKPTKASQEQRLAGKRRRGEVKRLRKPPDDTT